MLVYSQGHTAVAVSNKELSSQSAFSTNDSLGAIRAIQFIMFILVHLKLFLNKILQPGANYGDLVTLK